MKEKSISGNFDSVIYSLKLFKQADSIFYDSIHLVANAYSFEGNFSFNYSRFSTYKFIYIDQLLYELFGDTTSTAIFFDDSNRITSVTGAYVINYRTPSYTSESNSFYYDAYGKMNSFNLGSGSDIGSCSINLTKSEGRFFINSEGNDSMVITTSTASCGACWYCSDSIIVTFLSKANNTNELYLSYPTIPTLTGQPSYNEMFYFDYIPYPKMNGKLIDKVIYIRQNGTRFTYTNSYTFDAEERIKTAKIYYFDKAQEELIEFSY